jgi:uncharacterized protein (DUF983 family)
MHNLQSSPEMFVFVRGLLGRCPCYGEGRIFLEGR